MRTVLRNPWVRFIGLLALIYLAMWIIYTIRSVLIPFSLALIAAYIFDPVINMLEHRLHLRRGLAVALLVGLFTALVLAFVFVAVPEAVMTARGWFKDQKFENVREFLPQTWQDGITTWLKSEPNERRAIVSRFLSAFIENKIPDAPVEQSIRTILLTTFYAIVSVFQILLFFVVTVYLLLDISRVRVRAKDVLPLRYKDEILRISGRIDLNLKAFFRGQVVVVAALSCIFTAGLWLADCPFWYILGLTGGLGAFVPFFALASGMVPAIIISAAAHGDVLHPLAAAAAFAVGLTIDSTLITPNVIGSRVGLHPVLIILSILCFGTLFGFLGILFAVPIASVVKVFVQELFARYQASSLYTGTDTGPTKP